MDHAITKTELIDVMNTYVAPIYHIIGAACAALVIIAAIVLVIKPFIKRIR